MSRKPETITIEKLRKLASGNNPKIREKAKCASDTAEYMLSNNRLGSILLDMHLRHIQVYAITTPRRQTW